MGLQTKKASRRKQTGVSRAYFESRKKGAKERKDVRRLLSSRRSAVRVCVRYIQREWVLLQIIVTAEVRAIDRDPRSIDGLLDGSIVWGWRSVGLCRLQKASGALSGNSRAGGGADKAGRIERKAQTKKDGAVFFFRGMDGVCGGIRRDGCQLNGNSR